MQPGMLHAPTRGPIAGPSPLVCLYTHTLIVSSTKNPNPELHRFKNSGGRRQPRWAWRILRQLRSDETKVQNFRAEYTSVRTLSASWRTCALPGAPEKRPITLTRLPGPRLRQDLLRPLPRRRRHRLRRRRRLPPQRPNPRARRQPRRPRPRRPRPFPAGSTAPSRQTDNVFALIIHRGRPTTNRAPR